MADHINVVALIKIKPENIKDAEPLVKGLAEASRKEPGVIKYEIYRVKEKEGVYVFLEQYKTQEDFENHRKTEHFLTTIGATKEFLLEPPTIVSLEKEQI
jgi:quinol monooxygenase YgiN